MCSRAGTNMVNETVKLWLLFAFFSTLFKSPELTRMWFGTSWNLASKYFDPWQKSRRFIKHLLGSERIRSWFPEVPLFLSSGAELSHIFDFLDNNWNCFKINTRVLSRLDKVCGVLGQAYTLHWVQFIHTLVLETIRNWMPNFEWV